MLQDKEPLWVELYLPSWKLHTLLPVFFDRNLALPFSTPYANSLAKTSFRKALLFRKRDEKDEFALHRLLK